MFLKPKTSQKLVFFNVLATFGLQKHPQNYSLNFEIQGVNSRNRLSIGHPRDPGWAHVTPIGSQIRAIQTPNPSPPTPHPQPLTPVSIQRSISPEHRESIGDYWQPFKSKFHGCNGRAMLDHNHASSQGPACKRALFFYQYFS